MAALIVSPLGFEAAKKAFGCWSLQKTLSHTLKHPRQFAADREILTLKAVLIYPVLAS
jgi:hypothetical protein